MINKVEDNTSKKIEKVSLVPDVSSDLTKLKTKVETTNLKSDLETSNTDETLIKYIKDSAMYTDLKALETTGTIPDFTVEKFAKSINTTVETYLKQSFKIPGTETLNVSTNVIYSLSIGIQFAMMDALAQSGDGAADFFTTFGKTDTNDASSTFTGLTKAFGTNTLTTGISKVFGSEGLIGKVIGGAGKTNVFFDLAKKVENSIGFISRYCGKNNELGDGSKVEKLANANKFRLLLADTTWSDDTLLLSKTPTDMGLTVSITDIPVMDATDLAALQAIVGKDEKDPTKSRILINTKTISAIKSALPTAQSFLEKRATYKNSAIDLMKTVSGFFNTPILGLGTFGNILGFQNPLELFGSTKADREKGGVINFVLKIMGFHNGIEGLYEEFLRQSMNKGLTTNGKKLITNTMADYKTLIAGTYTGTKTADITALGISSLDAATQLKIPTNYNNMKTVLYDNAIKDDGILNTDTLTSMGIPYTKKTDATTKVDTITYNKSLITDKTIDKYLLTTIPTLANNTDFMAGITTSDDFMFTLTGELVCGTSFAGGVALGLQKIITYETGTTKKVDDPKEVTGYTSKDLGDTGLVNSKMTSVEYKTFADEVVVTAKALGINPEYLMKVMFFESSLDPSIQNSTSNATGLIQFLEGTAVSLGITVSKLKAMTVIEQLAFVKKYFEKQIATYGKLTTLEDVYLAVFSPAFIGKPMTYVAYYKGDAGYEQNKTFDTNKDGKMTVNEITETVRTTTNKLTFFTETTTNITGSLDVVPDTKIEAKTIDDVLLFGDSHAGGIELGGFKGKISYHNGFDSGQLLTQIKKEKTTIQKYKSLIFVTGTNDISKGLTDKIEGNLTAIQKEIFPVQLILSTLEYSNDKTVIPDAEVDKVNAIFTKFAKDNSLPLIDIHKDVTLTSTEYVSTGLAQGHYTTAGYKKIADDITIHITGIDATTNLV